MSTLSNIFNSGDAGEAQPESYQSSGNEAFDDGGGAMIAPPQPYAPGDDGDEVDINGPDTYTYEDTKEPDVLMPGGEMDPEA